MSDYSDYKYIMDVIIAGDVEQLRELAQLVDGFPDGKDDFIHRHWLTNAVDCGTLEVVRWMLSAGVPVRYRDDEGYTALHSAIDRKSPDRYEVLEALIAAGADLNAHGCNDWTPAHHAAVRNDVRALKMLVEAGADLSICTRIDEYATPLEEAMRLGGADQAVAYLQNAGLTKRLSRTPGRRASR